MEIAQFCNFKLQKGAVREAVDTEATPPPTPTGRSERNVSRGRDKSDNEG